MEEKTGLHRHNHYGKSVAEKLCQNKNILCKMTLLTMSKPLILCSASKHKKAILPKLGRH